MVILRGSLKDLSTIGSFLSVAERIRGSGFSNHCDIEHNDGGGYYSDLYWTKGKYYGVPYCAWNEDEDFFTSNGYYPGSEEHKKDLADEDT